MPKLYEIAAQYRAALDAIVEAGDTVPPEAWADTLEALEGEAEQKVIAIAGYCKELEADAQAIKDAANAMLARAKSKQESAARLKGRTLDMLTAAGLQKIECPWFQVSVRANGGKVPVNYDQDKLPDLYKIRHIVTEVDTENLRLALEAGIDVPGASLGERGRHLRIA